MAQRLPLWLVQAKCLPHYQANLVGPDEYEPDSMLGKGDVMHLTCVDENGTTVAVLVPGAFHKCICWPTDPSLTFDEFQSIAAEAFEGARILTMEAFDAVPVFSDGSQQQFFKVTYSSKSPKFHRSAIFQLQEMLGGRMQICEKKYTPEARFVDERNIAFAGGLSREVHQSLCSASTHHRKARTGVPTRRRLL